MSTATAATDRVHARRHPRRVLVGALSAALVLSGAVGLASPASAAAKFTVSATTSASTVKVGGSFKVSGTVKPKAAGKRVKLQRKVSGTWTTIATKKLSKRSTYSFTVKAGTTATTMSWRVYKAKSGTKAKGVSKVRTVRVFRPVPPTPIIAMQAGDYHSCALTNRGGVKCWGFNKWGQLGNGATTTSSTPTGVAGLTSGVSAISAGSNHTCALTAGGAVKCWGGNYYGQLGDGTITNRRTPVTVSGLAGGVSAISAGEDHTCAVTAVGAVKCWGSNTDEQLGYGTGSINPVRSSVPVNVAGLSSGVAAVSAASEHNCVVTTAGEVSCWGAQVYGQLGDGVTTMTAKDRPVPVSGLSSGVRALSSGDLNTCALTTAGAVKCWGFNEHGQIGDGSTSDRAVPTSVSGLSSGIAAIGSGDAHTCAVSTAGAVKCWGYNYWGQLGDGSTTDRLVPTSVSGLAPSRVVAMGVGDRHTCAVISGGTVKCWGNNGYGQLGDRRFLDSTRPVGVTGL